MKKLCIATLTWIATLVFAYCLGKSRSPSEVHATRLIHLPSKHPPAQSVLPTPVAGIADESTPNGTDDISGSIEGSVPEQEINRLAEEAISDPNPLKRSLAFSKLLESLSAENAMTIMKSLTDHDADGDEWELFRYAWGSVDPEGAIQHALSHQDGRRRHDALEETITGWASVSPEDAKTWIDAIEDPKERERYRDDLVSGMADHDIGTATRYVLELAESGDKRSGRYLETVTREQMRKGNIQQSVSWAEGLPEGGLRGQAMDAVANRYVDENPEAAAAWASRYADADYAARVIEEVGDEWAERDPEASVDWLASLPEGRGQREGMRSALDEWAEEDPTAASTYLANLEASPMRDSAASGFARGIVRENPEAAIAWAGAITENEMRVSTLTSVARDWYRRDAEAARAWLDTSGLPPKAVESVLSSRGRRR